MKLKKGDEVIVLAGKDRGKKGKIARILKKNPAVIIPGINIYKRHLKKRDEKTPGGIIKIERPISISKIALICTKCGRPTRIGFKITEKEKIRICRKCEANI